MKRLSVVLLTVLIVLAGCRRGTNGPLDEGANTGDTINTNAEFEEMLGGLGVNTNIGGPTDPTGAALPSD
jgi:hypothetical protein